MYYYLKIFVLNVWRIFIFVNFESFSFGMMYKRSRILKLHEEIFYIVKFINKKFGGVNPKSSNVKTYDYSPL